MNTIIYLNWIAKVDLGAQATWLSILILVCCTRILLHAKMLKEIEIEQT